jgi:hypothetical protein
MSDAIKTNDIAGHAASKAVAKSNNKRRKQAKSAKTGFVGKTFGDLNESEKDDLLKAVALELGLVEPDP